MPEAFYARSSPGLSSSHCPGDPGEGRGTLIQARKERGQSPLPCSQGKTGGRKGTNGSLW